MILKKWSDFKKLVTVSVSAVFLLLSRGQKEMLLRSCQLVFHLSIPTTRSWIWSSLLSTDRENNCSLAESDERKLKPHAAPTVFSTSNSSEIWIAFTTHHMTHHSLSCYTLHISFFSPRSSTDMYYYSSFLPFSPPLTLSGYRQQPFLFNSIFLWSQRKCSMSFNSCQNSLCFHGWINGSIIISFQQREESQVWYLETKAAFVDVSEFF